MSILDLFIHKGKSKNLNIGIGLGQDLNQNKKILDALSDFTQKNPSKIFLFGKNPETTLITKKISDLKLKDRINVLETTDPSLELIEYLNQNKLDCIIRGYLSSNEFLKNIMSVFQVSKIYRLALLETISGQQFFFGPVGIDECNNVDDKIIFIQKSIREINSLELEPRISILSGGRIGDLGRDLSVDNTIKMANEIVDYFNSNYPEIDIKHEEILIENAVRNKSNLIVAPSGISGNLIYRTLVHLGGGKAYGAIYMNINSKIIDTSRVGKKSEIEGALILATALSKK